MRTSEIKSNPGRQRNARLNQAYKHATSLTASLEALRGSSMHEHVDEPSEWADAREALNKLTQCFHEANALNNLCEDSK